MKKDALKERIRELSAENDRLRAELKANEQPKMVTKPSPYFDHTVCSNCGQRGYHTCYSPAAQELCATCGRPGGTYHSHYDVVLPEAAT